MSGATSTDWGGTLAMAAAEVMLSYGEGFAPVFEAGMGLRTQLEEAGWSPAIAETLAAHVVMQNVEMMYAYIKKAAPK